MASRSLRPAGTVLGVLLVCAGQVAGQTSPDLRAQDVFEREAEGASSDVEAAKAGPDELPA